MSTQAASGEPAKTAGDHVKNIVPVIIAWIVSILLFFPIFWMTITAFKTEQQAYSSSLFFTPTLDSFREVFARSNYFGFALLDLHLDRRHGAVHDPRRALRLRHGLLPDAQNAVAFSRRK